MEGIPEQIQGGINNHNADLVVDRFVQVVKQVQVQTNQHK